MNLQSYASSNHDYIYSLFSDRPFQGLICNISQKKYTNEYLDYNPMLGLTNVSDFLMNHFKEEKRFLQNVRCGTIRIQGHAGQRVEERASRYSGVKVREFI